MIQRYRFITAILLSIALLVAACNALLQPYGGHPPAGAAGVTLTAAQGTAQGQPQNLPDWLTVYFTDPNPPDNLGHGIDQFVLPVIDSATKTIDVASFNLNLPSVIGALVSASQRGVQVRAVYDSNGDLEIFDPATDSQRVDASKIMRQANIRLVDGGRENGLMHDKIIIVDGSVLFIGSWNLSYNDTYRNDNNLLKITEPKLVANYQAKFNELFVDRRFGAKARLKAPYPSLTIDGIQVETFFAPEEKVMARLVKYVQSAKKKIHFMAFTYTHPDLYTAMIAQSRAGVEVQGVIEDPHSAQSSLDDLYCARLPVRIDGNRYSMHHKVIILDGDTVVTGSFNFTKAADTINDDNVIVIHSPDVAALYEQEFQKVYGMGVTPSPADMNCTK